MSTKAIEYIVVQAGGKGTRLQYLTENRPKALVPVDNRPMLFHLFEKFPEKRFIIIADYKADVMEKYLSAFAKVKFLIVGTDGKNGTCSGLKNAIEKIPDQKSFMLIWSDLVLPDEFKLPEKGQNYVGLSKNFRCRWRYENGQFAEVPSETNGVAGLFVFKDKTFLEDVPSEGELVRWLGVRNDIQWTELPLYRTKEFGLLSEYQEYSKTPIAGRCRPFNKLTVNDDIIIKEPADKQGAELAEKEKTLYQFFKDKGYGKIPYIYSFDPFSMERIHGKNIFEYTDISFENKKAILSELIENLKELHSLGWQNTDYFSIREAYYNKTLARLDKVRSLVPFANEKYIRVNGRNCRNVFFFKEQLYEKIANYHCPYFTVIHGDNTFSNMLLDKDMHPVLIDPRGYFGFTRIYGDPVYDWGKLYYSLVGNYDQFNLKRFRLHISEEEIHLEIDSNGWEDLEGVFFSLLGDQVKKADIKLIHAVIWLSLTTYAWEDYDSICGAFYNGLYYLEEALS